MEEGETYFEPWCDLTVNLDTKLPENMAYLDTNNCDMNIIQALEKEGLIEYTGTDRQSGRCIYPLYKFSEDFLNQIE